MEEPSSQGRRTEAPDGDLPLAVRQRQHRQVVLVLPVVAIVPVVIAVVPATTLAPVRPEPWRWRGGLASGPGPCAPLRAVDVADTQAGRSDLLWAGFGWATIEVVYTLVTALAVRRLLPDPSAKAPSGAGCRRRWVVAVRAVPGPALKQRSVLLLETIVMVVGLLPSRSGCSSGTGEPAAPHAEEPAGSSSASRWRAVPG